MPLSINSTRASEICTMAFPGRRNERFACATAWEGHRTFCRHGKFAASRECICRTKGQGSAARWGESPKPRV